jgi:hypothetical protein
MATQVIATPGGIAFSGFYFPEILRELLQFLRENKERIGLTDENEFEVHVQLLRAFALVGHLNNTRLDVVATELLIDSANLLESVKRLLRLIGIELLSATPAVADVVMKLSESTSVDLVDFVPTLSEFATESTPPITFEDLVGSDMDRTDQVSHCFGLEGVDSGTGFVSSASPEVFSRDSGAWGTGVSTPVGSHLFLTGSGPAYQNGGEYRVTQRLNNTDVRVVKIPGSQSAGFITESGLLWTLRAFTADGAAAVNAVGPTFQPWAALSGSINNGDCLFVAHEHAQFSQLDFDLTTFVTGGLTGVWEYFDSERSAFVPTSVVDLGSTLRFDCTSLLGVLSRSGAEITVTYLKTGAKETVTSIFAGGINRITTSGLLGQVTPSTDQTDYSLTADWVPFDNIEDTSSDLTADGLARWDLPQTIDRSWLVTDVNLIEANWSRYRVVTPTSGTPPVFDTIQLDQGDLYVIRPCTQGETIGPQVIGSSTGAASQTFRLPETPYLDDTETIEVDEGGAGTWIEYTHVLNFLNSTSTSRHYMRQTDATDRASIIFGDGINGKVPPAGIDNVRAAYRIGGDIDGNVGPDTIVVNADGVNGISEVYNPRSAVGWRIKDGGNAADLARLKRDAPAGLRTRDRAVNGDDAQRLAINKFVDSNGTKPVVRAFAEEEKFGPKTVGLLVVGAGGTTLTGTQLEDLEEYFNGDKFARPPTSGVLVANQELTAVNFEPSLITIEATVVWPGGSAEAIKNALLAFVTPLAVEEEDGITWVFDFGDKVSYSKVHQLIHDVDPNIRDIPVLLINGSQASAPLGANELPITTAASIEINAQES